MNQIKWKVFGVSLAGFSHQADGRNCEDYHALQTVGNGWLVAALSDGAGSAIRSIEGAKAICEGVVSAISSRLALSDQIVNEQVETSARSWIEESIERVRSGLLSKNHEAIAEFHATLVGVIAGQNGGLFFHIGDGDCLRNGSPRNRQQCYVTSREWRVCQRDVLLYRKLVERSSPFHIIWPRIRRNCNHDRWRDPFCAGVKSPWPICALF